MRETEYPRRRARSPHPQYPGRARIFADLNTHLSASRSHTSVQAFAGLTCSSSRPIIAGLGAALVPYQRYAPQTLLDAPLLKKIQGKSTGQNLHPLGLQCETA